jgi:hypothetical protein
VTLDADFRRSSMATSRRTVNRVILYWAAEATLGCGKGSRGEEGHSVSDLLSLKTTYTLGEREMLFVYEVSNRNTIDLYLLNRIYRTSREVPFVIHPDIIYVKPDASSRTVWFSKIIPPSTNDDPMVNSDPPQPWPYITPVRTGTTFREEVHLPLPLTEWSWDRKRPPPAEATITTYRLVYFTLGYFWRLEGEVENEEDVQGTPVIFLTGGRFRREGDYKTIESERVRLDIAVLG